MPVLSQLPASVGAVSVLASTDLRVHVFDTLFIECKCVCKCKCACMMCIVCSVVPRNPVYVKLLHICVWTCENMYTVC